MLRWVQPTVVWMGGATGSADLLSNLKTSFYLLAQLLPFDRRPSDKQNTGRPGRAGAIVTAGGLIFIASTDDNRFRALDSTTGREIWSETLERRGNANPMTYRVTGGKQYVVVVATDEVVAYALP